MNFTQKINYLIQNTKIVPEKCDINFYDFCNNYCNN